MSGAPFKVQWEKAFLQGRPNPDDPDGDPVAHGIKEPIRALVIAAAASYANADGTSIFPSRQTLAKGLGVSRDTARRALKDAVDAGWFQQVAPGGGDTATRYRLTIPDVQGGGTTAPPSLASETERGGSPAPPLTTSGAQGGGTPAPGGGAGVHRGGGRPAPLPTQTTSEPSRASLSRPSEVGGSGGDKPKDAPTWNPPTRRAKETDEAYAARARKARSDHAEHHTSDEVKARWQTWPHRRYDGYLEIATTEQAYQLASRDGEGNPIAPPMGLVWVADPPKAWHNLCHPGEDLPSEQAFAVV